jgi:hypothetical protein
MIGIGTPSSQSNIPRPMEFSSQREPGGCLLAIEFRLGRKVPVPIEEAEGRRREPERHCRHANSKRKTAGSVSRLSVVACRRLIETLDSLPGDKVRHTTRACTVIFNYTNSPTDS